VQVSLYRKVFAEAMQLHVLDQRRLIQVLESGSGSEGN
jgi:hypothetical protein